MIKIFYILLIITINLKSLALGDELKIVYKINQTIITSHDIKEEVNYLLSLNKRIESYEKEKIAITAENSLVREKIKKNEIEKFYNIDYDKAIETEVLNSIIKNFRLNLGYESDLDFRNYLISKNIDLKTLKTKFVIEQYWNQLIVDKFAKLLKIDNEAIENRVEFFLKNNSEQLSFNLSEIIFSEKNIIDNKKKYQEILNSINNIGFKDTAILHSISNSSQLGGELGWINQNQMSDEILEVIKNLNEGDFSKQINTPGGVLLLKINQKKLVPINFNKEEEINKLVSSEKNRKLNEYSIIYYREIENKSYVKKF